MIALALVLAANAAKPAPVAPPPPVAPNLPEVPVAAPVDPLGPMPDAGAPVPYAPPTPVVEKLQDGADLWVLEDHRLPLVSLRIEVPGGAGTDPQTKLGLATLADQLMTKGAGARDAQAFAEIGERLAIQIDVNTTANDSVIDVSCERGQLDTALSLVSDMILHPTFAGSEVKREKKLEIAGITENFNEPTYVAKRLGLGKWWGAGHPYANPVDGTTAGLKAAKKADLVAYHAHTWVPSGATITLAGDLSPADAKAALDKALGAWTGTATAPFTVPPAPTHPGGIVAVDRPGSAQTMFYLVFPGEPFADPKAPPLDAGTVVLGGTFTSRLNQLLREKEGFTYGVSAHSVETRDGGVAVIGTRIRTDATAPAAKDLASELAKLKDGVTADEVVKAQGAWRQDLVEAMETRDGMVGTYAPYHAAGLGPDAVAQALAAMGAVTKDQVDAAMKAYDLDGKNYVWVLVGDKAQISKPLADAGFTDITWTDVH